MKERRERLCFLTIKPRLSSFLHNIVGEMTRNGGDSTHATPRKEGGFTLPVLHAATVTSQPPVSSSALPRPPTHELWNSISRHITRLPCVWKRKRTVSPTTACVVVVDTSNGGTGVAEEGEPTEVEEEEEDDDESDGKEEEDDDQVVG